MFNLRGFADMMSGNVDGIDMWPWYGEECAFCRHVLANLDSCATGYAPWPMIQRDAMRTGALEN